MGFCCYCKIRESHHKSTYFFQFPPKNHTAWLTNMGWKNWTPKKSSTLCSNHFTKDCIDYRDKRARLRKGAVPTIFRSSVNGDKLLGGQPISGEVQTPSSLSSDVRSVLSPSYEVQAVLPSPTASPTQIQGSCPATETQPSSPNATHKLRSPAGTQTLLTSPEIKEAPTTRMYRERSLQHDHHYIDTPTTLLKKLNAARTRILKFQSEQKVLKQKLKRSKITIQKMKSVIAELRQQKMVCDTGLYSLESFKTKPAHLFTRIIENNTKSKPS